MRIIIPNEIRKRHQQHVSLAPEQKFMESHTQVAADRQALIALIDNHNNVATSASRSARSSPKDE